MIVQFDLWLFLAELLLLLLGLGLGLVMLSDVLKQRRAPANTAAWLLILIALPYLGVALYLLFGARKLARPRHRLGRIPAACFPQVGDEQAHHLDRLLRGLGVAGAVDGNESCMHESPEHALARLLSMIESAKRRILIDMYDLAGDRVGKQIFAALTERASQGVEVKVLVDDIGSLALRSAAARKLRRAGGKLVRFRPVTSLASLRIANLRNHRKIVIVDGWRAWSGGRNLADAYLSPLEHAHAWQDFSFDLTGPATLALENIAISDWQFATGERLEASLELLRGCPASSAPGFVSEPSGARVQIVPSGPDCREDAWYSALLCACFTAKRRLWLVTPYFVPDEALLNAIALAARRGVEVILVVPKRSDNRIVDWVRRNYLRELALCGVQVLLYQPRMLHAKLLLLDDSAAAAGTANLDARSLFLNYEVMSVFYSHAEISAIGMYIRALLGESRANVRPVGWLRETLSAPLRILAPLL